MNEQVQSLTDRQLIFFLNEGGRQMAQLQAELNVLQGEFERRANEERKEREAAKKEATSQEKPAAPEFPADRTERGSY